MERSTIIRKLMEDKGMKVSDVSKESGIAYSTVKSILENGIGKASYVNICKICESVGITADKLEDMIKNNKTKEPELSKEDYERIRKYKLISDYSPDGAVVVDMVMDREYSIATKLKEQSEQIQKTNAEVVEEIIPRRILAYAYYGKIAAAGTSVEFSGMTEGIKSYPENDININADYVIGVSGDSMEPEYYDGDIVYVKKAEHLNVGEIGIFQKANSIYIKKVGENGLISLNSNYPGLTADDDRIIVLGKVLGKAEE